MEKLRFIFATFLLCASTLCAAQSTINVTTAQDENNDRKTNVSGETFPLSTGCSLREAIAIVQAGANTDYPNDCTLTGSGPPYTINLSGAGGTITLGGPVPDPSAQDGSTTQNTTSLSIPSIPLGGSPPTFGAVILLGPGTIGCDATADMKMFIMDDNSDFTLTGLSMGPCVADGGGIAVTNNGGNLTINTVTFTGIGSKSGGSGGCINHSEGSILGSLIVDNAHFNGCFSDDGSNLPSGPGAGTGGAMYITTVSLPNVVTLTNVTFNADVAGDSGGAIYWSNSDSLGHSFSIKNALFTLCLARGAGIEHGGGAIYAATDQDDTDSFLILNTQFTTNHALSGSGGAIMLAGGKLAYLGNTLPLVLTGGVLGSAFTGNTAEGAASADLLGGSGGAIFAEGTLTVLESSFTGNTATGSGGAIALRNQSSSTPATVIGNTTFTSNTAGQDGGGVANIVAAGTLQLINDTIDGNTANAAGSTNGGGALYNTNSDPGGVTVTNSILSNSSGTGGNCQPANALTDGGHNLQFNPNTGCSTATAADPLLNSPSPFGGIVNPFVITESLKADSPASGGGDQSVCAAGPIIDLDENASPRPQGKPNCDIGAYESSIVPDLTLAMSHMPSSFTQGDAADTYTLTATNGGNDGTTGTITVTVDPLPMGLTATSINGGADWTCTQPAGPCTYTKMLSDPTNAPDITLTVSVASNAPSLVTPTASVSGGSESDTSNDTASSPTDIISGSTPVRLQSFEVD